MTTTATLMTNLMGCPPAIYGTTDTRLYIDGATTRLKDITAYNIVELEDVNALEYLQASLWNIIVIVGPQYYAFNRMELYTLLKGRRFFVDVLDACVHETPLNQAISSEAVEIIMSSEYSVYELQYRETITYGGGSSSEKSVSLYSVYCHTIEQWENGIIDRVYYAPIIPCFVSKSEPIADADEIDTPSMLAFVDELNRTIAGSYENTEALLTALFQDYEEMADY
jgi:hypothetical protein